MNVLSNGLHRLRDGQTCQQAAASKSEIPNLSHRLRDGQTRQRAAARKRRIPNLSHRLRDGQTCQRAAASKSMIPNLGHRPRDGQTCQRAAILKSRRSNLSHRLRDDKSQQATASCESSWADECFSVGDAYVTYLLHLVARCACTLKCRLDVENNLQAVSRRVVAYHSYIPISYILLNIDISQNFRMQV